MNIFWKLFPGLLFLEIASAEILKLEYQVNDGVDADSYIGNIPQDSQQVKPSRQGQHFSVVKGKAKTAKTINIYCKIFNQ